MFHHLPLRTICAVMHSSVVLTGKYNIFDYELIFYFLFFRSSKCVVQKRRTKACYCDKSCTYFRDCCTDYLQYCRHKGETKSRNFGINIFFSYLILYLKKWGVKLYYYNWVELLTIDSKTMFSLQSSQSH